jgi:hypothetical protein
MRILTFLAVLTVPLALSGGAFAAPHDTRLAASSEQCLRVMDGCKAACFGKKARLRGHCFAACEARYNNCKAGRS